MGKEIGFKEITSGLEKNYYTSKLPFAEKILEEAGISLNKENITPIDLFSVPEGLSSEKKKEIIAKNLNFKVEELEKRLPDISRYWQEAKKFYRDFLMPKGKKGKVFPKEIEDLEEFSNLEKLENTLGKATVLKKGDKLGFGPLYCALFTLMIAVREYEKEKFEDLERESEYFTEQLFQEDKEGIYRFHTLKDEDDGWSQIVIFLNNEFLNAWFSFRGKSKNSMIMKLAIKPEFSVEERIQDGIGLKFEVESEEDAKELFLFLPKFLADENISKNFSVEGLVFENTNLFNETKEYFEDFLPKIKSKDVSCLEPSKNKENKLSNRNFQAAKLLGKIKLPEKAGKGNKMIRRNFEIQVVLTNNKNETGLAQHKIYKRTQKLALFSRLFGSFNEKYLDLICQEASEESGLSKEKIKEYFEENFLVRIQAKGSKTKVKKYVAKSQVERWLKAGIFPKNIIILEKEKLSEECQKIIEEQEEK